MRTDASRIGLLVAALGLPLAGHSALGPQQRNLGVVPPAEEKRLALVIGNNAYPATPLRNTAASCRSAYRNGNEPGVRLALVGLRLARNPR